MTTTADTFVRARIGADIKQRASAALEAMGLTISDAIRLTLIRIANEGRLPFELAAPKAASQAAVQEDSGQGGWLDEVLAFSREHGFTDEEHAAFLQAIHEADEPITDPQVFEE